MRVDVAFTPAEDAAAEIGIVVDVIRASSTIAQALAAGYERVLCCSSIDDARQLRADLDDAVVGGERSATPIDGFDAGASPREFLQPLAKTLILTTTNGTSAILAAAERCGEVLIGSLLNLNAVAAAATAADGDVVILCAGFKGAFAFDDAYCAGRIVAALAGVESDAAVAARVLARAFPNPHTGLTTRTYGPPGLEEDIAFCARESVLETVPRLTAIVGRAAEITAP